ncbi:MAG: cell wall-associated NlpC family hydrolase, partial [Bacteroidia bacterium]
SKNLAPNDVIAVDVPLAEPTNTKLTLRDSIVNFGKTLLGTPYIYGACNEDGFDCSGFVYYVFRHFQIEVPRSSRQFKDFGEEVLIDNVQKGDILVFLGPTSTTIGHVGIVSNPKGKESDFIHASSGRSMKVIISSLKQDQYAQRFVKAVRAF